MPNFYKKGTLFVVFFLQLSGIMHAQQISGNIFIDRDGLTDNNINTSAAVNNPTVSGLFLFVNLLNSSGQAVASTAVTSTGDFLFNNIPTGDYVAQLTINASNGTYATPAAAPNTALFSGWVNTGEFIGNGAGNDGNVNGKSASITISSTSIINAVNFGIERLPETSSIMSFIGSGGLLTNVLNDLTNAPFRGNDAEDLPVSSSLFGKSIKIQSLIIHTYPALANYEMATLFYNGNTVSVGQVINSYDPTLLKVSFSNTQTCSECFSGYEMNFQYSFVDAAGFADPTPALYRILYPVAASTPFVVSDFSIAKRNCAATLNWKTLTEFDTKKFEVEYNIATNNTFKPIASIDASGYSNIEKKYQFNYILESEVVYNFRIKMTKRNGTVSYSDLQTISCLENELKVEVAPNPAINIFKVNGLPKGKNTISIYSKDGNLITSINATNNQDIDISKLPSGVYVLKIINENGSTSVERLVKY
jgi:hypothetical protein